MDSKMLFVCILLVVMCEAAEDLEESRGKKKKIALLIYFADIILKKLFVLKLIYAFVFWVVIHKAGYFLSWFISYLKQQKQDYVPHYHDHHDHHYAHYDPYRRQGGRPYGSL